MLRHACGFDQGLGQRNIQRTVKCTPPIWPASKGCGDGRYRVSCRLPPDGELRNGIAPQPPFLYRVDMEVEFTPEQQAQLAQLATKAGTDAEHSEKDAALRLLDDETAFHFTAPELPVLHLGAMTSLHRRDIYDDIP